MHVNVARSAAGRPQRGVALSVSPVVLYGLYGESLCHANYVISMFNSMRGVNELAPKRSHLCSFLLPSICVAHAKRASDVIVQ